MCAARSPPRALNSAAARSRRPAFHLAAAPRPVRGCPALAGHQSHRGCWQAHVPVFHIMQRPAPQTPVWQGAPMLCSMPMSNEEACGKAGATAAYPQSPRSHRHPGPARSAPRRRRCAAPPSPRMPHPPPPRHQSPHSWMRWPRPWQRCQGRRLAGAHDRPQPPPHDWAGPWAVRQAGLPRCHGR